MTDLSHLSEAFQNIVDMVEDHATPPHDIAHPRETAHAALRSALSRTILPRRITVRGTDGARLSMVVRNREIIRLAEVHPSTLWNGEAQPQDTACRDNDGFAHPFASALDAVIGEEAIRIEQALLTDPLGLTSSGFPAARITQPTEQLDPETEHSEHAAIFFDAFPALPRARFGGETAIDIPANSQVDEDWMRARVDEVNGALNDERSEIQLMTLNGEAPRALALVWIDGEGCVALATKPSDFTEIERHLDALRAYL